MSIAVRVLSVERFPDTQAPGSDTLHPPTNLAVDPGISTIQLTWTASLSSGVTGYRLWKRVGATTSFVGDVLGNASSHTFSGLAAETVHHLLVASLRGDEESERASITTTTLAAAVLQSTIGFRQLEFSGIENSTVEVVVDRFGGDNTAIEIVDITETPGNSGTGTNVPAPPTGGGVDYTITWPGGVSGQVKFLANETEAIISFFIEPDVFPETGEYVSFGIAPHVSDAYVVDAEASTSVVDLIDVTVDTYADSILTYTALEGATYTHIRAVVDIDPTHPADLPKFLLVGGLGTTTADVRENTRLHNNTVDSVVVVGKVEHAVLTGSEVFDQTVILREDPLSTHPGSDQFENINLSALRFELRGLPTHGTIEVDPFDTTLAQRNDADGRYGKEVLSWGYAEPPARNERIGFKTLITWVGDVDMVMIEVLVENNLFNAADAAGMYAAHPEVAGDVYYDALGVKTSTIPAGWEMGHYHHNETSMVGDDFIVSEGGLQVTPSKCRNNIKRFYLRKTATSTQTAAEAKFSGAGLGMVTAGPLMPNKHFSALGLGVPAGIWPDSTAIRAEMEGEWAEMLDRIKSGADTPAWLWGSQRWGHYHSSGTRQYVEGGGHYLFGAIGFSNTTAELNLVRHYCYMAQARACTGLNSSVDGSVVTAKTLTDNNGDEYPFLMALDGSDFETWLRHMRPDVGTTHGTGAINPNITAHNSGDHSLSLMPLTNAWSIPGATAVISHIDMFPLANNSGSYGSIQGDPPQGTHHKRHMIMLEGVIRMEGSLMARWLAGEEASHVMHSHTQYPQDATGTTVDWKYHDLEWPMVEGIADIAEHAEGRPFHCQNGGGAGTNPARIHRLSGEVQGAVLLGMACSGSREFRAETLSWAGLYISLADLRCSPNGWGARAYSLKDPQTSPHTPGEWSTPDLVNQRGGWPLWIIGQQSMWQMFAAEGFAGVERRIRPRTSFPSGQDIPHKRMIVDTFMEQVNRATARGRKVPSAYGIVAGSASSGVDNPFDTIPDGLLNGVGTGNNVPNWLEELNRPSDGGHTTFAKVTLREEAIQWAMSVASFLEQNPGIVDVPIVDILRNILEGVSEEDDGAFKSLTYAEAALVCTEGYSFHGDNVDMANFYPEHFYRQRRWVGLGLMQQADYWLAKFPHWGAGDKTDLLPAPTGFSVVDTANGTTMSWDPVPGAASYRVEWMELRPHEGGIDGSLETSSTSALASIGVAPDTFNSYFRVQAINAAGDRCTSTRLAPLVTGSRLVGVPETSDTGSGGGGAPQAPVLLTAIGQGGSIEVTFSLPSTGAEAVVIHGDYDLESTFAAGNSTYTLINNLDDPIGGVYKMSITGLTNGTYYVGLRTRSPADEVSLRSNVLTATVVTAGSGSTNGDAPVGLTIDIFDDGVSLGWSSEGNDTGSYYAGYGARADTIDQLSWTNNTILDVNEVPTEVRYYSVQHTHSDATRSPFAEPGWSYPGPSGHIGGINSHVRPIERPQGTPTDVSLGHVGCGIDTMDLLAPPSYWVSSGEYVLPYVDPLGINPDSPATVSGYLFDRPVRVAGSELAVQSFLDCEMAAYGPLPQDSVNYTIYVKAGDSARINLERCTIRYGSKALYFRGGTVRDCLFKDVGEDGIHIDWLVHNFGLFHCAFPGIGNVAAQGLVWDVGNAWFAEYGTSTPEVTPHGDGMQIRSGNNGGAAPSKALTIEGNDIPTLSSSDGDMPGDHTIISMSSAIFLETANGPIAQFTIRDNWVGTAANCIQLVDDAAGFGNPQGDLLNNIVKVGWIHNAIDSDVVIGISAANRDTAGNNL